MINSINITDGFADVNETYPTVGRVGRIMGEFASVCSAPLNTHKPNVECSITSDIA